MEPESTKRSEEGRGREFVNVSERQCISKRKQGQRVLVNIIIIQIMIFDATITVQMVS